MLLSLAAGTFSSLATAQEEENKAIAILKKAEESIKGRTSIGTLEMIIETPDFQRKLTMKGWWIGNEKALIEILSPPREAGNKTLKIGKDLWMYLRNTETTIRIPPSMMLQSWNGSDFTYDDLVRESNLLRDYTIKLLGKDTLSDGTITWVLELQPKPNAAVVWGKILYWVRTQDELPAKVEYYDEHGKKVRTLFFRKIRKLGNRLLPTEWILENHQKPGQRTIIRVKDLKFDIAIPDRIFSLQELKG